MFSRKFTLNVYNKYVRNIVQHNAFKFRSFSGVSENVCRKCELQKLQHRQIQFLAQLQHNRWVSRGILDGDVSQIQITLKEKELKRISELYPQPRVTLNEFTSKTPERVFEVHYKQNTISPKGSRKKTVQSNDWTCTYAFVWPEKIKFECTAVSKRQAADKAATQAIHWLHTNKHIDDKGNPIFDRNVLMDLRTNLNSPIQIEISEKSMERIERIWSEYEGGIKSIYEKTFKEAHNKIYQPKAVTQDSTLDNEDYSEDEFEEEIENDDLSEFRSRVHPVYGKVVNPPSESLLNKRRRSLSRSLRHYTEELTPLPIDEYADRITSTVQESRVTIVVGAAGCGKSTRVPASVLRHCGVSTTAIVTEPRRVAAIGLAERVASEMREQVGESIGFQVRLHAKLPLPPGGSVLYCTSGVLLRRLQSNPGLEGCSHVFIDEAHERDVNTDVILLLLKRALDLNPLLKIVIMSATLDINVFTKYFDSCPLIEVPGRTYPVDIKYIDEIQRKYRIKLPVTLENCNKEGGKPFINSQEVVEVIKAVDRNEGEGAILVFLPGWAEIKQAKTILDEYYGHSNLHIILPVHSRLSTSEQSKMFSTPMPGVRKIVLATNIAETSVTIPDVVYVIDTGAHKENRIKEGTGIACLETTWVSQAAGKQRAGRAGRVQPGNCYRLYTKEKENEFVPHNTPEILRIPLEQTALNCKTYAPDDKIENFLSQLPEPPSRKSIRNAVDDLVELGALTQSERLTRLGEVLTILPLQPDVAVSLLAGGIFCAAIPAANLASFVYSAFSVSSAESQVFRETKREFSKTSDHAALHWIQEEFEQMLEQNGWNGVDEWCTKYGLRKDRLRYIKALSNLHLEQLLKSGIFESTIEAEELNRFSGIDELMSAILLFGSNALLVTRKHVRTKGKLKTVTDLFTSTGDRAHINTESVNYGITKTNTKTNLLTYFGGMHSTERRALVVYNTSLVTPQTAVLFCRGDVKVSEIEVNNTKSLCLPRHKLNINIPSRHAEHLLKAREMIWNTFRYYVERDIKNLDFDINNNISRFRMRLIKTVARILVEADREYIQGKTRDFVDE